MATIQLNTDQVTQFIQACDQFGHWIDESDVVSTNESVDNFITTWGQASIEKTESGDLYTWSNIQTRKGAERGDLMVMPVNGGTVSYFSGQA